MTRDQINEWAVAARCFSDTEVLLRFATLVATNEREECAKICDEYEWDASKYAAQAIRARGK